MSQAKERQEINMIVENEIKKSNSTAVLRSGKAKKRHDQFIEDVKHKVMLKNLKTKEK